MKTTKKLGQLSYFLLGIINEKLHDVKGKS